MQSTAQANCPLSELVDVQPGYLSRGRVHHADDGTHHLLQGKDISEDHGVCLETAFMFHDTSSTELYTVTRGDILFTARGLDHRAYFVEQDLSDVLAAATFYILRPERSHILPRYLAWWLNLPRVQSAIGRESGGTYISYIRRQAIENLAVPVPGLEVQHRIERVLLLGRKRDVLRKRIEKKRDQYMRTVCERAVRRATEKEGKR